MTNRTLMPELAQDDVRTWQAGAGRIDYLGEPLRADGDLGARTRWAMYLETLAPWRQTALHAMLFLRGLSEQGGANRGHVQDRALALCGSPIGSPWCAAVYSYALWMAGLCRRTGFVPSASVVTLRGMLRPVSLAQVQPGDFATWANPDGTTGHGGMVVWPGIERMVSCDGNIGDECDVVSYPTGARQYYSPEMGGFSAWPGEPPKTIRQYGAGKTR